MKRHLQILIFFATLSTCTNNFCSEPQQTPQRQFAQEIMKFNGQSDIFTGDPKEWANKPVTIGEKTGIALQFAIDRLEELQSSLNPTDEAYQIKLHVVVTLQNIIKSLIRLYNSDTEKLSKKQQQIPFIKQTIKEKKLLDIVELLKKAFNEKSVANKKKMNDEIKQKFADYLAAGGQLAVEKTDLIQQAIKYDNLPILEYIIEKTKINPKTYIFNNEPIYPIIAAAIANNRPIVAYLIKHGVDVDAKDKNGKTALFHAAEIVNFFETNNEPIKKLAALNVIKDLLDAGADTKDIAQYITPLTKDGQPNSDYNQDIATYYNEYVREAQEYRRAASTEDYK
jgi:hypothetical protein